MPELTTIAVTGATGFVGRAVVRELLARGYNVRALCRDREKAVTQLPADRRVVPVLGHIHDGRSARELVTGAQAVINLIGIIRERRLGAGPGGPQTFERLHVDAPRILVEACRAAGVRRFLHMSALGVTPDGAAEYQRTKFEGEQIVRRSGLDWTVFRPGLIHGPGGELTGLIKAWCSGDSPPFFFIPFFSRPVHHDEGVIMGRVTFEPAKLAPVAVDDVAKAFVEALERPAAIGEVYNVVGSEQTDWKRMLEAFRDNLPTADHALPVLGLPGPPHVAMAKAAGFFGLGALFPFDAGMPSMAQEDTTADLAKLRTHLGVEPKAFTPVMRAYAGSMK